MTITYTWSFRDFEVDGSDKVTAVKYEYRGSEDNYHANIKGKCGVSEIAFDSITESQCIAAATAVVTEDDMQTNVSGKIDVLKAANTVKQKEF